jgi:hypothetical protein
MRHTQSSCSGITVSQHMTTTAHTAPAVLWIRCARRIRQSSVAVIIHLSHSKVALVDLRLLNSRATLGVAVAIALERRETERTTWPGEILRRRRSPWRLGSSSGAYRFRASGITPALSFCRKALEIGPERLVPDRGSAAGAVLSMANSHLREMLDGCGHQSAARRSTRSLSERPVRCVDASAADGAEAGSSSALPPQQPAGARALCLAGSSRIGKGFRRAWTGGFLRLSLLLAGMLSLPIPSKPFEDERGGVGGGGGDLELARCCH